MSFEDTSPVIERNRVKIVTAASIGTFVGGFVLAWLVGNGYVEYPEGSATLFDINAATIFGFSILVGTMLICCTSSMLLGAFAARIPGYGDMEIRFEAAKELYEDKDWEAALSAFVELMTPNMNHKRALYYAARCSEELDKWEDVKKYCQLYLKMQSKDKEVWELLARAHRKLFEYEEAQDAELKMQEL
ncbi:MAG: tetratricopeptide repeat protein [Candidatus Thorarchaeota archaeon]|jgi:tetratricopeptide (TPR) repeat protein